MPQLILILLVAALVFGVCYLIDRAFTKLFRSKAQHRSGLAVRTSKRYGVFGVIFTALGVLAICVGVTDGPVLLFGGIFVLLMGSGLAVRTSKRYGVFGVIFTALGVLAICVGVTDGPVLLFGGIFVLLMGLALAVYYLSFGLFFGVIFTALGVLAICVGVTDGPVLLFGGIFVLLMGLALAVYYLSFGLFYDGESFLYSRFGKKDQVYLYKDILGQKLYLIQGGGTVVELHMTDGSTVSLQSSMDGVYPFLDTALALAVYYLSFGLFYDGESFLYSRFGKKDQVYLYKDILGQKLYLIQGGGTVVELHMTDGSTVSLQSSMDGVYPFLDTAFAGWCLATGRDPESCDFHDPSQSLWFPTVEDV